MRTLSWCLLSGVLWKCPGELSSEVLSSQFYRCSSGIPEFRQHQKSLLCSCWWDNLDATQYWGGSFREYRHNSYNRCFSKVEVNDFRSFSWLCVDGWIQLDLGIASLGGIFCVPCIPNTRLHNQKVSGVYRWDSSSSSISSRRYLVCDWVILTKYLFHVRTLLFYSSTSI